MPSLRLHSEFTYQVLIGTSRYYYTLIVAQSGAISVKAITTPQGAACGNISVPQAVLDEISISVTQLEDLFTVTTPINGYLVYANETSQSVVFASPLASNNYRVVLSVEDFLLAKVTNKTTTGFTLELSTSYTGQVGYDVIV